MGLVPLIDECVERLYIWEPHIFLCRVRAAEAGDRARVLEEFWQRKREALANKYRGGKPIGGPSAVRRLFSHFYFISLGIVSL